MDIETSIPDSNRAAAMRLFALAPWAVFDEATKHCVGKDHKTLRGPDVGLFMLRGRMGSTGNAFNLGEATVTRCTVARPSGIEGHAYIMGRNAAHASRAALCDALFQENPSSMTDVLTTIEKTLMEAHQTTAAKAAATKVDFFTMVRGDD
jgi:alpha-D-ribose 1-methylphosphonate 5-triphosphate synthase subunit PhnG